MTFLATIALPHAGLVAVDTLAYRSDGTPSGSMSKLYPIPHANMIVACRGSHAVLTHVLAQSWRIHSIDAAVAEVPKILQEFARSYPAAAERDSAGVQLGSDLHVIGYSPERGRMVHRAWRMRDGFAKVTPSDHSDDLVLSHRPNTMGETPNDEAEFVGFACRAFADARARGARVGGNLLLAKVDASGLSVRCLQAAELKPAQAEPALLVNDGEPLVIRIRAVNSMGAVGPWTYLAHTVDGPTSVGTADIAPGAATATDQTTNASGSVSVSNPDYSITVRSTVNTLNWTNTTSATVNLQVEHNVFGTVTNSGAGTGNGWFEFEYSVSSGGGAGATASPLINVGAGEQPRSFIDTVSVGAGLTVTLTLKACVIITSGTSVTNTWRTGTTRYAAILR